MNWSVLQPPGRDEEAALEEHVFCATHGQEHAHMRECEYARALAWTCSQHPQVTRYSAGAMAAHVINDAAGLPLEPLA